MDTLEIKIVSLIPTRAGCAVFLGDDTKVIHFFIDLDIGLAINAHMAGEHTERPMTYDLMNATMNAFGARMRKMIINHYEDEVYFSRLYWEMENETLAKKVVEIDSRPSDGMALAVRQGAPIQISKKVWEEAEDMTFLLEELNSQSDSEGPDFL